jgi:hypothetical protein
MLHKKGRSKRPCSRTRRKSLGTNFISKTGSTENLIWIVPVMQEQYVKTQFQTLPVLEVDFFFLRLASNGLSSSKSLCNICFSWFRGIFLLIVCDRTKRRSARDISASLNKAKQEVEELKVRSVTFILSHATAVAFSQSKPKSMFMCFNFSAYMQQPCYFLRAQFWGHTA